jgi:tetratricopeptide (TPR) repeat protein
MVYIGNSNMGKTHAATKALKKAMELAPNDSTFIYNYSLLLEKKNSQEALDFLEKQDRSIKEDPEIKCKIVMLKDDLGMNCKEEAKEIVESYKNKTSYFSDFEKRVLLPKVFRIAGEKYSYVDPKKNRNKKDEEKYLESRGTVKRS